jgi:Fusaric acid resistance protein-like
LLPYGRSRNYGLLATFLTPLVVVLIDLLTPAGWRLAEDRLIDTLIGCAIVLLIGYAPWPTAWYAHLPQQFAETALDVSRYLEAALGDGLGGGGTDGSSDGGEGPPARSRLRRNRSCPTTRRSSQSPRRSGRCSVCSARVSGLAPTGRVRREAGRSRAGRGGRAGRIRTGDLRDPNAAR